MPFAPHTFATHSFAIVQAVPLTAAQVFVTALQRPLAHTACAVTSPQTPTWSVSVGSASPAALSATQVNVSRLQCSAAAQSASIQHEPEPAGMQTPSPLQAPDWHVAVLPGVHPGWPSARPHLPFAPHAFATHWFAFVQAAPFAAAQVFVVALQEPVAHTAVAAAASQVPVRIPSVGIAVPRSRSTTHVPAARSQCSLAAQSASTQQPPFGVHSELSGEHAPDWQRPAAVAPEHVPSPSARPHLAFVPHAFATHSFAAVQAAPFGPAQVPVVALQRPLAHAALKPPLTHASWSVSVGSAAPERSIGVHVKVARWQKLPPAQSASSQQLDAPCGMHALAAPLALALQRPDWQSAVPVATVHGPLPFGTPHWPFAPHTVATHAAATVQAALFAAAQVFVTALQAPVTQTCAARAEVQTPSWSPSLGSATPAALSATHFSVVRSQWSAAAQSPSTKHPPDAGTHVFAPGLHAPDWQREAVAGVQPAPPSAMPQRPFWHALTWHSLAEAHARPTMPAHVFVVGLQTPLAHTTVAAALVQSPLRRPSFGIATPSARSARHVSELRSQYWLPPQSPSPQQPAPPAGTQRPLVAQVFETHWAPAVQTEASTSAHVFAAALQRPVVHAAFSAPAGHVWWRLSAGRAEPGVSFAVHV